MSIAFGIGLSTTGLIANPVVVPPPAVGDDGLDLESGDDLLLESGDRLLLEDA